MSTAEFNFEGVIISILCSENELMEEICKRFAIKAEKELNDLIFLYSGTKINLNLKMSEISNNLDKERKKISILVQSKFDNNNNEDNQSIVRSPFPICPECYENIILDIQDYNIKLSNCRNNHSFIMSIKDYVDSQFIDLSKIICDKCKTNKSNTYNNQMNICNNCKMILCPLCSNNHDKAHNKINYDNKNYICEKHNDSYISYCKSCKNNICLKCHKEHQKHDIISFAAILPDQEELSNELIKYKKIIDDFIENINKLIKRLNFVKENIETLYKIHYEMIKKYDDKKRNYEIFMCLNNIKNNNFIKDLLNINRINEINDQIKNIMKLYQKIKLNYKNKTNKISISEFQKPIHLDDSKNIQEKIKLSRYEYNLDSKVNVSSIKMFFAYPPLIGLENIGGNDCMNAILQCFCNIVKFVDFFKYDKHLIEFVKNDINDKISGNKTLTSSFKLLIEKLWPDKYNDLKDKSSFTPMEFKYKISKLDEGASYDIKVFLKFLIMTLHKELNLSNAQNMNNNLSKPDKRNQQLMFNIFTQDFCSKNKSIISDLFFGVNYYLNKCENCYTQTYNYQYYFYFDFPLDEIMMFKKQNGFNMNSNNNEINIYDSFDYYQRIKYLTGNNQLFCEYCRITAEHSSCTLLSFGPEIIIIVLTQGKDKKNTIKMNFNEQLNLFNYIEHKEVGVNYKLFGVISNFGVKNDKSIFISFINNPINNVWYEFKDTIIKKINNFDTEVKDSGIPYLLFYKKIN